MANVLINGINYSWGDVTLIILGVPIVGFQGIEIKSKQEKTNNYGQGNEPISQGFGRKEYEATIKGVYYDELRPLIAAAPDKDLLKLAPSDFTILVVSQNGIPSKLTLKYASFIETPFSVNEGDTKIINDLPLLIAGIKWN